MHRFALSHMSTEYSWAVAMKVASQGGFFLGKPHCSGRQLYHRSTDPGSHAPWFQLRSLSPRNDQIQKVVVTSPSVQEKKKTSTDCQLVAHES